MSSKLKSPVQPRPLVQQPTLPRLHAAAGIIVLLAALTIAGLRPLIEETVDTAAPPLSEVLSSLPPTRPTVTLWIDLIIVVLWGAALALRLCEGRGRLPRTGLAAGFIVLALAAAWSCHLAGNRRLALGATLDLLTLPLLAMTLAWMIRQGWHQKLALAVILGSAGANVAECLDQRFVMQSATVDHYRSNRDEFWARQGIPLDSYEVALFERRVYDPAVSGFFAHSNVAGGYFLLALACSVVPLLSAGRRGQRLLASLVILLLALALILTRSRGAMVAGGLAAAVGLACRPFVSFWRRQPRRAWCWGWMFAAGALGAVVICGLVRGALPGGSLAYRWWYWEASASMVAENPLGVGSAQFGRLYPRYKDIKSPEEVANPHNFLAHAAAEWGLAGLAGVVLMLLGASAVMSGASGPPGDSTAASAGSASAAPERAPPPARADRVLPVLLAVVWVVVFSLRIFVSGHQDQYYVMGTNIFPMLGWATAAACVIFSCKQALRCVVPILGLGLAAFLVSDLISFALFVPGSATTFWAVTGLSLAARRGDGSTQEPGNGVAQRGAGPAALVVLATAVACAAIYLFVIAPVARSWPLLTAAREMARRGQAQAAETYLAAHRADPLDPTSLAELTALEPPLPIPADELVRLLVQLDPENPSTYRRLAAMELRLGTLPGAHAAAAHYDDVVRRYPSSPKDWLRASQIQSRILELGGADHSLQLALEYLERALALDGRRDPNEIRRFTPQELDALHKTRDELRRELSPS
jgi:hypothetical protein